jgi:hypothetical protein
MDVLVVSSSPRQSGADPRREKTGFAARCLTLDPGGHHSSSGGIGLLRESSRCAARKDGVIQTWAGRFVNSRSAAPVRMNLIFTRVERRQDIG